MKTTNQIYLAIIKKIIKIYSNIIILKTKKYMIYNIWTIIFRKIKITLENILLFMKNTNFFVSIIIFTNIVRNS